MQQASNQTIDSKKFLQEIRDIGEKSFYFFAKGILGFDWLNDRIHLPLCKELQNPLNKRLRVVIPRGWLKTTLCSISYPIWRVTEDPSFRSLLVQNTFTNACSKLQVTRGIFERNTLFRSLYPEILPDKTCTWKTEKLCVRRSKDLDAATFEAAGCGTQVTSRHYNLITEDDTVAPDLSDMGEMAVCPTKEGVDKAIGWHRLALPLLVNVGEDRIIVVGTRWFERDLLSWIKDNERSYVSFERRSTDPTTGKPLYPERFNEEVLEGLRLALGPYMFSCLYENEPIRSDDMIFSEDWFKFYETEPSRLITYTTVDPAGDPEDTKGEPDWNVVVTCGKDVYDGKIYVLDYEREKCSPGRLITMIFNQVQKWNPVKVGVETVAYQKSLQYWLRENMRSKGKFFCVEPIRNSRRSKNARIQGLQPVFSSGSIYLRKWMFELRQELLAFPYGKYDDIADALSMQLELWQMTRTARDEREKEPDPFTLEGAIEELRGRHKPPRGVGDVLHRFG